MLRKLAKLGITFLLIVPLQAVYADTQDTIPYNPHHLKSYGYLRTGIGGAQGKGQLVDFVLPSSAHKFRMGNEANNYAELSFQYTFQEKDSKKSFQLNYMASNFMPYGTKFTLANSNTAELYVRMNNIVDDVSLWVGRRYYDRRNVEMLDFFWSNVGQNADFGAGVEHIKLRNGKLNIAAFQFSQDRFLADSSYRGKSYTLDARVLDVKISSRLSVNGAVNVAYRAEDPLRKESPIWGASAFVWAKYKVNNMENTLTTAVRSGPLLTPNGYTGVPIASYENNLVNFNLAKARDYSIVNNFVYDDKERHAVQGALVYRKTYYGFENQHINWFSIGGRYLYYLSRHVNLALEIGNDYVKDTKTNVAGSLQKITFSPQISWNKGYYSRPVIRPFVTYAHWSNSLMGKVGVSDQNDYFKKRTQGLTYGLQLEVWW